MTSFKRLRAIAKARRKHGVLYKVVIREYGEAPKVYRGGPPYPYEVAARSRATFLRLSAQIGMPADCWLEAV